VSEEDEARRRVRQLLLSGDNTLKNRHEVSVDRARGRFEEARAIALEAGLDEGLLRIIDLRLASLPQPGGARAS
jgi:hypothetical protein